MKIEQKYQKLTDIEHCLLRPGMWIGTTAQQVENFTILSEGKFQHEELCVSPAFIKIFDEIISNSADEHKRNSKLNKIEVQVDQSTGKILIFDNGGIPVVQHKEHKEWIPQMIFSNLRAGSNFNDFENRTSAGLHGVGATLTNIFSNKFIVETCDGKNSYYQEYSDNMKKVGKPLIKPAKRGFTRITFFPDLKRFDMKSINDATLRVLQKRAIDIAATNPKLSINFNGETYHFKTFEDYIKLYTEEYFFEETKDWKIGFAKSENGFQNVSFVNSVHTKDGGTHVEYITNQLIAQLREMIKKKHRVDVKPSDIRNHLYIFIDSTIVNSFFSSQTKEKLITEVKDFGTKHEVTDKLAKLVFKSEIIQSVLDWIEKKALAQERAELRKLNKDLDKTKIPKLIDAQRKGDRGVCILGIYEGLCLEENTEVLIFNNELKSIKIKDVEIGDFVISHENKIEQIYQVSKRIERCIKINLKNNESISCTVNHRFFVFDKSSQSFDFVKASDIKIETHQFLKNRLIYLDKFYKILDIVEFDNKFDLILSLEESIMISKDTKLCVFDILSSEFKMILPEQLKINNHHFVSFRHI